MVIEDKTMRGKDIMIAEVEVVAPVEVVAVVELKIFHLMVPL